MLLNIALLIFAAVFLSTMAIFLLLRDKLSKENQQTKKRLGSITADVNIQDEFLSSIVKDEKLSNIPLLDRFLNKFRFSRNLKLLITQAGSNVNPGTLILSMLSLGGLAFLLSQQVMRNLFVISGVGLLGASLPLLYLFYKRKKRLNQFETLLPEALDMITNALKAGFSFDSAMRMVAQEIPDPLGIEMAITYEEQNLGIEMSTAMNNLKMRVPSEDLDIFITALLIHKKSGGNLTEVLGKTGKTIRDRLRLKKEVRTKTIHGRFSGMILILLPIIMAILIYLLSPEYEIVLIKEKIGNYMLAGAILMQILGIFIIRKIVNIRV
jgi:tight adherence protein B